jgi:hypothetical protein
MYQGCPGRGAGTGRIRPARRRASGLTAPPRRASVKTRTSHKQVRLQWIESQDNISNMLVDPPKKFISVQFVFSDTYIDECNGRKDLEA